MSLIPKLPPLIKAAFSDTLQHPERRIMQPPDDTETAAGLFRIFLAWAAYFFGSITLQEVGIFLAIIFTTLQIVILLRDKFGLFNSSKEPK